MANFYIPDKEQCPSNGYTVQKSRDLIEEICNNPNRYDERMCRGAINDAITIYKYTEDIPRSWIENVINTLSEYVD